MSVKYWARLSEPATDIGVCVRKQKRRGLFMSRFVRADRGGGIHIVVNVSQFLHPITAVGGETGEGSTGVLCVVVGNKINMYRTSCQRVG